MKRNLAAIRGHLRNGTDMDANDARLCAEMTGADRSALSGIGDAAWGGLCDKAKMAGVYHDDIKSPALPLDLVLEAAS